MNRRKFLLRAIAVLAATCLGKPALGPIWESPDIFAMLEEGLRKAQAEETFMLRTGLPQGTWTMFNHAEHV